MTELEKSMEIIQFISNAKKTTPVKMFTDEEIKTMEKLLKKMLDNVENAEKDNGGIK